ncbi:MAG: hypothetical protein D4R88_09345 [Methanosarcinales archaeon]|nr:MAG: hypothetical protein D4R88_09345 [Methanosarcinales archaeon]
MLTTGIIIYCIASILKSWSGLNRIRTIEYERSRMSMGLIEREKFIIERKKWNIVIIMSTILGLVGAILIGYETSFWLGLILFVAFWCLWGIILVPLLEFLRL